MRPAPVYENPSRGPVIFPNNIRKGGLDIEITKPVREATVFVRRTTPINSNPFIRNPQPCVHTYVPPVTSSGCTCNTVTKSVVTRYINSPPFLRFVHEIQNENKDFSFVNNRSKREVPFLKHGYKFMMNMLPEFIQEPIKNTVNEFALTHPDKRLQKIYNQPRKLTLRERLQMQTKKNIALLKNKLRNRIVKNNSIKNSLGNDVLVDKEARIFMNSLYDQPNHPKSRFSSRSNFDLDLDDLDHPKEKFRSGRSIYPAYFDGLGNTDTIREKKKIPQLQKVLLLKKLRKLNEDQGRTKRSTIFKKHWQKRKQPSGVKKRPNLIDTSEIILPFYEVKEDSLEENHNDQWEMYFKSSPRVRTGKHRYRRDDDFFNFLEPFTFKDVATENQDTKEHFLRSVIREELGQYQVEKEEPQNNVETLSSEHKLPHSPLLHIITFPMNLIRKFTELTKEAFPIVGSLPNIITGTKRYFKDFGRNFRKNILHLTSGLIGDFENLEVTKNLFGPKRQRRSLQKNCDVEDTVKKSDTIEANGLVENPNEPNHFLVFGNQDQDTSENKVRKKRYLLKRVDEDELEEYLLEKLRCIFENLDGPTTESYLDEIDEKSEKTLVLQHLKPKIILDNNGKPFLEINGYKRPLFGRAPLLTKPNTNKAMKLKMKRPFRTLRFHDSSEEVDSEKIASLINRAKNHLENNVGSKFSEMPVKTIKEKISQLLFETDVLVHMDFEKYHDIYDDFIALQHTKTSIVQDWKRLIMSNAIDDINAKMALLERFKELQYYKDVTLSNVVAVLSEDNENVFVVKKLIKMLVRLQKLQCLINQVVANFQGHLHISNKAEIEKEIKYVDFMHGLNFATAKSRNDMINNLIKDRDAELQRNISLLDKLKKLLMYEATSEKVEKEANLLWEMKNIEKMQKTTIEELKQRLDVGYRVKNELKILFDLLRRYEICEADQKKILSNFELHNSEEEEDSSEKVGSKQKKVTPTKKIDLEELRSKWRERLNKRTMLLRKKLKRNSRRFGKKLRPDDDD